jgi:hypothetical protein
MNVKQLVEPCNAGSQFSEDVTVCINKQYSQSKQILITTLLKNLSEIEECSTVVCYRMVLNKTRWIHTSETMYLGKDIRDRSRIKYGLSNLQRYLYDKIRTHQGAIS